jgi:hypothetical protein
MIWRLAIPHEEQPRTLMDRNTTGNTDDSQFRSNKILVTTNPGHEEFWSRRILTSRTFWCIAIVIVVLLVVDWIHENAQSQAVKQRLIGRWTYEFVREDGATGTRIFVFRPDGTIHIYPFGRPEISTEDIAGDIQWDISDGELILTYDHHFTRNATFRRRMRQVRNLIWDRVRGRRYPVSNSERCLIDDPGGDTITLTPHPDMPPNTSWLGQNFTLTRVADKADGSLQVPEPSSE